MPSLYNRAGIMTPPAIFGFLLGSRTIFTPGTTNYTTPRYAKLLFFQLQAGGGAGGRATNSTAGQIVVGGGGAAGSYAELLVPASSGTYVIVVGAGGSGATPTSGGNSSITGPTLQSSSTPSNQWTLATGGSPGSIIATGTTQAFALPTSGSTPGTTLIGLGLQGRQGGVPYRDSGTVACSGKGGNSRFGSGGRPVIAHGTGNNASGFGAGGSGSMSVNAAGAVNSGNGSAGICIAWEYY